MCSKLIDATSNQLINISYTKNINSNLISNKNSNNILNDNIHSITIIIFFSELLFPSYSIINNKSVKN